MSLQEKIATARTLVNQQIAAAIKGDVCVTSSFQAEDMVVVHLVRDAIGDVPVICTIALLHMVAFSALTAFDPTDPAPLAGDDPAQLALVQDAVVRLLPSLHPEPVATERCVYDNTADADFILDRES